MSEKRTCGTCANWEAGLLDDSPYCKRLGPKGDCRCPLPFCASFNEYYTYERTDATDCPCYKPKGESC